MLGSVTRKLRCRIRAALNCQSLKPRRSRVIATITFMIPSAFHLPSLERNPTRGCQSTVCFSGARHNTERGRDTQSLCYR